MSFRDNDFFVVLPSNSSMNYFPDNTTTKFTTKLPRQLRLDGEWAVSLAEISYPMTFLHVNHTENSILLEYGDYDKSSTNELTSRSFDEDPVPSGVYQTIESLLETINELPCIAERIEFKHKHRGYVEAKRVCHDDRFYGFQVSPNIARLLGFSEETHKLTPLNLSRAYSGVKPASLARAIPNSMFIYSDICESYITGDVQTPLLRVVPIESNGDYAYGSTRIKYFPSSRFIPLIRNNLHTIEIDIRDEYGNPVAFEEGTLTVTLRFKRIH